MSKVILITGGTSGIGLNAARELKSRGCRVYELSRRESGTDAAVHIQTDVTDEVQVQAAVQQVLDREGHIDVVINNAGFGISDAIEYTDTEEAKKQFDVNFFGMVRVNRAVLPIMHRQGYGRADYQYELCGGAHCHSVPGLLFRVQGSCKNLFHGSLQ